MVRKMTAAIVAMVGALLLTGGLVMADTHAPWPADWNNWADPNLWVPVGNPGNAADTRYDANGYGAVSYAYNMGKFEVTTGQYTAYLNAVASTDTYSLYNTNMDTEANSYGCDIKRSGSSGTYTYSVDANWANRPVNFVSWGDAARYSNWLTNGQPIGAQGDSTTEDGSYYLNGATTDAQLLGVTRKTAAQGGRYYIPTEDEWYKAAYHKNDGTTGNYWGFPTGSNSDPNNDLLNPDGGNNANFKPGSMGYTIGSPYYRTDVGDFENSESPYGTFDQGGNVREWNETIVSSEARGIRGGSSDSCTSYLHAELWEGYSPTYERSSEGFRIVEVPEPCSIGLFSLAGGLLFARRKGKGRSGTVSSCR
jgi:formylglycine-generating enzyme required for sulfatase activity